MTLCDNCVYNDIGDTCKKLGRKYLKPNTITGEWTCWAFADIILERVKYLFKPIDTAIVDPIDRGVM